MIDQHLLDRESFARESTIDTMKGNMFLKHGDTVLVALGEGGYSFYNIVEDPNVIELDNGLFAVLEKDKRRYDKTEIDRMIAELNDRIESGEQNNQIHNQLQQSIQTLANKLSEKADKTHTHTKSQITDFPTNLPNPFSLTIINGVNRITYDGSETREITVAAGGGVPESHTHPAEDIVIDREHQFVTTNEKDKWNSKAEINHNHDERYKTSEEIATLLSGKSDISHTHPANNIRTDDERSFVSKIEKDKWNDKSDKNHKHHLLTIRNGAKMVIYDGSEDKDIFIDSGTAIPNQHEHNSIDIIQDASHRFVTDSEKQIWNSKADKIHNHHILTINNGSNSIIYDGSVDKTINIESTGASIIHNHKATDIATDADHNFVTTAEKYSWDNKADANHKHNALSITTDDSHQFITSSDRNNWNGKANAHDHPYLSNKGGTINGTVTINGDLRANRVYNAVWNDYAEFFERGEETEPGDIIALNSSSTEERYVKASKDNFIIVGVHSDSFAHLIGGKETSFEENIKEFIPVGLAGRVKCKVVGKVSKGDLITVSQHIPGVGISINKQVDKSGFCSGYSFGIALEDKLTEDIGMIKILIK